MTKKLSTYAVRGSRSVLTSYKDTLAARTATEADSFHMIHGRIALCGDDSRHTRLDILRARAITRRDRGHYCHAIATTREQRHAAPRSPRPAQAGLRWVRPIAIPRDRKGVNYLRARSRMRRRPPPASAVPVARRRQKKTTRSHTTLIALTSSTESSTRRPGTAHAYIIL